ncbi:MAG TPA: thrombospondin type 3 repeat-containing protein, partial [Verrucomicrobiae bacterium]|nr:thrombospondin type 3 repeat-containing protein [Verrucomicrobiae bacterium]
MRSGRDGDGDGYSDLEELLQETSPTDPNSVPAAPPGYEQHAAVDFVATPRPLDGLNDVETDSQPGTLVRLYTLSGSLLATTNVSQMPEVPLDASALFRDVVIDGRNELLLLATEPHFDVVTGGPDTRLGRELVSLIPSPQVAPIEVNYEFGQAGGVIGDEADAWINAAQTAYEAAQPETRFAEFNHLDSALAALLERKLRLILIEDELAPVTNVTLFPFRAFDAGLPQFDEEAQAVLEHGDAQRPAYDLKQMFHSLETLVKVAPNAPVQSLQAVTREVYRVSSALNNDAPGQYRLPLDVIRQFLGSGVMDSNYLAGGAFPPALLTDAWDGVQFLMDNLTSRPVTNLALRILSDSFAGTCTTLETADAAMAGVHLFDLDGAPYDFPDTFQLLPGSIVQVTGRPDAGSVSCAGFGLEVLSISLSAIPASSEGDGDGNLLVDAWEKQFLGGLGADPFGDTDGDGYSDLQEMFEGTDPLDGKGVPPVPMANLALPLLIIETSLGGDVQLEWEWPEAYADKVQVLVWTTSDLNQAPALQPAAPV